LFSNLLKSGNAIFPTKSRALAQLPERIEDAIEPSFGFRPALIFRTPCELRDAIAKYPFARRRGIDPSKLVVTFLTRDPSFSWGSPRSALTCFRSCAAAAISSKLGETAWRPASDRSRLTIWASTI
jgi:hypothetical protein